MQGDGSGASVTDAQVTAGHYGTQTDDFGMLQGDGLSVLPQLESIIAELLPELLSQHSVQDWLQSDQLSFMAALQKFAVTMLRYHFRSAAHLDLLRTVLAAVPDGATSDGECSVFNLGGVPPAW